MLFFVAIIVIIVVIIVIIVIEIIVFIVISIIVLRGGLEGQRPSRKRRVWGQQPPRSMIVTSEKTVTMGKQHATNRKHQKLAKARGLGGSSPPGTHATVS